MELLHTLLTLPDHLHLREVIQGEQHVTITLQSCTQVACCPSCGQASRRVHSHYWRSLQDLPLGQWSVQVHIHVVRFRCGNTTCHRQTFVEPLEPYARRYGRRTNQVTELLTHLGFELGGQGGKRVAARYRLSVSRPTLLRLVRQCRLPVPAAVRVLGVDDWALCRHRRYGTVLVDLEQGTVVDLLPEADANGLSAWLQAHPSVEVVSRDRSAVFAEGVQQGAPQAQQVADRWHLFQNLWDALVVVFGQHGAILKQLSSPVKPAPPDPRPVMLAVQPRRHPPAPPSAIEQARAERRAYWEAMFAQVHTLLAQGISKPAIAKQLGISERVVRKYSHMTYLPKKQSPKYGPRLIDPYRDVLREHLAAGPVTLAQLHRLLQAQGYPGSRAPIYQAVRQLRAELGITDGSAAKPRRTSPVSPQQLATWVLHPTLSTTIQDWLAHLRAQHPTLDLTIGLAQDFATFVRQHKPHHLTNWIEAVELSGVRALSTFARGLLRDFDAVCAACTEPWSNGPVEGHVHRIKFIKRQMYGRAKFDLLRLRILYNGTICT